MGNKFKFQGEKMKKNTIILCLIASLFFSGCSAKNGAIIGGTTGVVAGGLLGAGLSKQHVGNGKTAQSALQVGLVFGVIGALIGSATGYVVGEINKDDNKQMQEMIQSQKIKGL